MKQHFYLLNTEWLKIYINGNYCKIEIELINYIVIQLFTVDRLINTFLYKGAITMSNCKCHNFLCCNYETEEASGCMWWNLQEVTNCASYKES